MTLESHRAAMSAPIQRERIDPAEKADTPPYTTDDIFIAFAKAIGMLALAIVSAIMVAGGGAWLFTTFMDWAAPYWPLMANALGAL